MSKAAPKEAPVSKYTERPLNEAQADVKDIEKVEDRQPDQIADYHEKHPTLQVPKGVEKALDEQNNDGSGDGKP